MRRWRGWLCLALVASVAAIGCGGSSAAVTVALTPSAVTVLVGTSIQFSATVQNSSNTVDWAVNGSTATTTALGGNSTTGTITNNGIYTAPLTVPFGTVITITAVVESTSGSASATVTLDSGVRVSITGSGCSIGTGETFQFNASVAGVPTNSSSAVTWTVSSAGGGTIDPNLGSYVAPGVPETDTITATSVYDPTQIATVTTTIVAAADPTFTGVTPGTGARGAFFQDIYLFGTNFICTTSVLVNGVPVPSTSLFTESAGTELVRLFDTTVDSVLAANPPLPTPSSSVTLTFTAARQNGVPQSCSPQCQVVLSPVRPAIVGTSVDSIPQGGGSVNVDGGFFGTGALSNNVTATQFGGQAITPTINTDRQMTATIGSGNISGPGLYPLALVSSIGEAVANVAVQPTGTPTVTTTLPVGNTPSAVAINTATGLAVVANQGSNDVTLIDLTQSPPAVVAASICTGAVGATTAPCGVATAPVSVAVDNLRNIALVANSANDTVAVVNLITKAVTYEVTLPDSNTAVTGASLPIPIAVGVNPTTGRAIIAYRQTGFGSILDLTPLPASPPAVVGAVSISTGTNARLTVSQKLNWGLVTPGGSGAFSIVDLNRQTVNQITSAARVAGNASTNPKTFSTATVTTAVAHALRVGDAVQIQGVGSNFDGVFSVLSVISNTSFQYLQSPSLPAVTTFSTSGATASYARPVATLAAPFNWTGIAINDETQKAIVTDSTSSGGSAATIFSALDQTSAPVAGVSTPGSLGAAFNPLTNIAVVVGQGTSASVIDPSLPTPTVLTSFPVGNGPTDVAIDPGTDTAVIVNQLDGTVTIAALGTLRAAPQVLQVSFPLGTPAGPTVSGPSVLITSTLTSAASPSAQTLMIIGSGFNGSSRVRLDGTQLPAPTNVTSRGLTVSVPASMLMKPRRYALDVTNGGAASNAAGFTVIQSVNVGTGGCTSVPQGVAIDVANNLAAVTDSGCSNLALINLATGTGGPVPFVALPAGANPQGVAIYPASALAVVANQGNNTASIVDEVGGTGVVATVATDASPTAVAVDLGTGNAVVTASNANILDFFSVASTPTSFTPISVGSGPDAIAIDPVQHLAVVGNANNNNVSIVSLNGGGVTQPISIIDFPTGVVFDPVSGGFLIAASLDNNVVNLNTSTLQTPVVRVGINPTSIAYNFASSTMVTANFLSQTMTVVDFLNPSAPTVRAVLSLSSSNQYAVSIHPQTNLAVVADSVHGQVLLVPLPR